jgi:hypothetical protein
MANIVTTAVDQFSDHFEMRIGTCFEARMDSCVLH